MSKKPKTYTSTMPAYVDGKYYQPGEPFVTDAPKGKDWSEISKVEKAAADAAQDDPGDPPLEKLSLEALKAVAVTKKVNPEGLNKGELITAIKAANEPKL